MCLRDVLRMQNEEDRFWGKGKRENINSMTTNENLSKEESRKTLYKIEDTSKGKDVS